MERIFNPAIDKKHHPLVVALFVIFCLLCIGYACYRLTYSEYYARYLETKSLDKIEFESGIVLNKPEHWIILENKAEVGGYYLKSLLSGRWLEFLFYAVPLADITDKPDQVRPDKKAFGDAVIGHYANYKGIEHYQDYRFHSFSMIGLSTSKWAEISHQAGEQYWNTWYTFQNGQVIVLHYFGKEVEDMVYIASVLDDLIYE